MKILSWNMLFNNAEQERAFAFIRDSGADVMCLQEVPAEMLGRLRALPYELVSAQEIERVDRHGRSTQFLVTLSRFPVRHHHPLRLPDRGKNDPWRTRMFVFVMRMLGLWAQGEGERHALIADLDTPDGTIAIMNLHLPLHRFAWRKEEFELATAERSVHTPRIVCGDFNTLESRRIAILSWLLGGPLTESAFWRRERAHMEERFVAHDLRNPLRSQVTHPLSKSQLDHILVSAHFAVEHTKAREERYGSDHRPVFAVVHSVAIPRKHGQYENERAK